MSVRAWGNQYGHGFILDGEHLETILYAAKQRNCTPEEALNQIIVERVQKKTKRPLAGAEE